MYCEKCGNKVLPDSSFCIYCGSPIKKPEIPITTSNTIIENKKSTRKPLLFTIIGLFCVLICLLGYIFFGNNILSGSDRTIMIYVVGSNLESKSAIVSADLAAIDPNKIDLNKTNILLYTGGTEEWHNFISNEENGLYILKQDGFSKLESQEQYNLGNPDTLTNFIKYAYKNYKAKNYDLILYDHGGALDGAIYDDLSDDNLSLKDMKTALENSPFNSSNKFEAVLFRTCLNGTIEIANIFEPYSKYLIASEEISYGSSYTDVLSFLNNMNNTHNGYDFGENFIGAYREQMAKLDFFNSLTYTYSIIDLSKIGQVNTYLDEYINSIDIKKNYNNLVKIRSDLYQYGESSSAYNTIDLYSFVDKTKSIASISNQKLLDAINDAVVYNETNNDQSLGLSIYFPFKGKSIYKEKFLNVYNDLDYSLNYKKFIKQFYELQSQPSSFAFNLEDNQTDTIDEKNTISLQLTAEQVKNYSYATFTIFKKSVDNEGYYKPIFNTDDVLLDENGLLKVNYTDRILKAKDDDSGEYDYVMSYYRKSNNSSRVNATLYKKDKGLDYDQADIYFGTKDKKPVISSIKLKSYNDRLDGILLNKDDYDSYSVYMPDYKILDEDGKIIPTSNWESGKVLRGWDIKIDDEYVYGSLDDKEDYYAFFIIIDIYENENNSRLIKVGE